MKQTGIYKSLKFYTERFIELNWHKHPFFIPVVTFLAFFFIATSSFIVFNGRDVLASDSYIVLLSYDERKEVVPTRTQNVGDLLKAANISLGEGDVVEPGQDTQITEDNFRVNVYRARPVMINDGGQKKFIFSAATTPRSIAAQAGVDVYPEDDMKIEMPFSTLKDGAIGDMITINRATPASLNLYGTSVAVRTHATTVGELLQEKQVTVSEGDVVTPAQDSKIQPGTQVFVTRNGTKVETKEEEVAFQTETVEDASLSFGTTVVHQKGVPGKKVVTYEIQLTNDRETGRRVIQTVIASEPVKQIMARGKSSNIPADKEAVMAAAGISPSDYDYVNYIVSRESRWNAAASNKSSGAFGLCQALPGSKMASAGADWQTNPVTQLKWCNGYATSKFGSWSAAYSYWLVHHWW